ncbi:alkaline phosphatase D family protein [Litoribrevibacter euphylliae]|uniref:Alkaline phosphatase D family protein n=1 Tax=Litoribrevibacter euphylliae TaxID=1834034 RepID=A0ABV7HEP1_9GAMM
MTIKMNRRKFLGASAAALATPYALKTTQAQAGFFDFGASKNIAALPDNSQINQEQARRVFDLSVTSGDPTSTGVMLWTHINPEEYDSNETLTFQISQDPACEYVLLEGTVDAWDISANNDYTVKIDLDGQLNPNETYYYRFIYKDVSSRIGRCKTLPLEDSYLKSLKLAVLTCQDYTNGYYGALNYVANDLNIDFVIHLGDFIYETAGDPRFQSLPFDDRTIILPSDGVVALGVDDYRHLYKTYRSDLNLQLAMEVHTWILTTDDHETANDCYWDYERDTLGAPDHPFVTEEGNDAGALRQLKLDSQRAWVEYTPTRVTVNEYATHPHDFTQIYRNFKFGDLFELFMLDTRTYRTAHPCGENDIFSRYLPLNCHNMNNESQSMMGEVQFNWLKQGLQDSTAKWTVLGNQTYMGRMAASLLGQPLAYINVDAWDGYQYERDRLMEAVRDANLENFVVLTGDLHTYISSYVKYDYGHLTNLWWRNIAGVEFMTPSVTSSNLFEMISNQAQSLEQKQQLLQALSEGAIRINNPHICYFNSTQNGYSTLEFNRDYCEWTAYSVDKNTNSDTPSRTMVKRQRKHAGWAWLDNA